MKRTLSILLVALMLLGMSTVALADDTKTISYYAYWCGEHEEGSYIETSIEEALGIDIKVKKVAHTDQEAVNLMLAQDMPDCGWFTQSLAYMQDQELTRTIPLALVEEYAPGLMSYMNAYPIAFAQCINADDPTQLNFLPDLCDTYTEMFVSMYYIRYDWVQALGLDLGVNVEQVTDRIYVADGPIKLDAFTAMLDAFVNQDPDGDGAADTVGYIKDYAALCSAFGMINGTNNYEGKATPWYVHPNCKDLLNYLADLYANGLLYTEIFTIGWGQDWELVNSDTAGIWRSSTNALNSWASNRPPRTLLDNADSPATLLMVPGIASNDGTFMEGGYTSPVGGEKFYVRWDISDEKLIEILKFFDYTNYNSDNSVTATMWYGEENVDWQWNEDKTTPMPMEGASFLVGGDKDAQIFARNAQVGDAWRWISFEADFSAGSKYYIVGDGGIWNQYLVKAYKEDILSETDASVISNEYSADWGQIRDAYFLDVITGVKNTESDWDAYIAELNNVEFGAYLEELDKAPIVEELIASYAN